MLYLFFAPRSMNGAVQVQPLQLFTCTSAACVSGPSKNQKRSINEIMQRGNTPGGRANKSKHHRPKISQFI
jgi:hypothetical protein